MKKALPWLIALGLIVSVIVLAFPSIFNKEEKTDFFVKEGLSKIILEKAGHDKITLEKTGSDWVVNERYNVRKRQMNTLLETIRRMKGLYPVSDAAYNNVMRELMSTGVKTSIYNSKGKLVQTIYVGGTTAKNDGTYMLLERKGKLADRPYVVNIPGFDGSLTSRFIISEEDWRTKEVINLAANDISNVSLEYPANLEWSFSILKVEDKLTLSPANSNIPSQRLLNAYLDLFSSKSVETYINEYSGRDSIVQTTPYCILSIQLKDGSKDVIPFFYKEITERSKHTDDPLGRQLKYDVDKYYALVNNQEDFAIVQFYVFGSILRKYEDFFEEPS